MALALLTAVSSGKLPPTANILQTMQNQCLSYTANILQTIRINILHCTLKIVCSHILIANQCCTLINITNNIFQSLFVYFSQCVISVLNYLALWSVFSVLLYFVLFSVQFYNFHNVFGNVTTVAVPCVHFSACCFILYYCSV